MFRGDTAYNVIEVHQGVHDHRDTDDEPSTRRLIQRGIVLDYDAEGRVVAVEIIDAFEHLSLGADLHSLTAT